MSQNFEESPVSDSKMDISETTTSQESVGESPTLENVTETANTTAMSKCSINSLSTSAPYSIACSTAMTPKIARNARNINQDNDILKLDNIHLDNDSPNVLRLAQQQNAFRRGLTVANSHPLMSPPETDSDSDNGHRGIFDFPDVVPMNEPLRLANSTNRLNENKMCNIAIKIDNQKQHNSDITHAIKTVTTTKNIHGQKCKIPIRRESSSDLMSIESDQELSQYQASVEPNNQTVTLTSHNIDRILQTSPRLLIRRRIPITADLISDDMSSLDSISNHSFDDDVEQNLASLSPSSSVLDGFNDKIDDYPEIEMPKNSSPDPIPTYTAEDERRDSRNWQKITLPDGRIREIDMRVIEPYKRVLSHGGYLKAGGHNAIVLFCACHLPDRSRADYHYVMDNLFLYVVKTLEQLVTEDYVLIYLHGGSSRRNIPPFPWLKKCYQLIDRRLRKSLKNLYLVHPSFWLKSIVWMSRPFVSSKFWRKLIYVHSLEELYSLVSVEKAAVPDKVKLYNSKYT